MPVFGWWVILAGSLMVLLMTNLKLNMTDAD